MLAPWQISTCISSGHMNCYVWRVCINAHERHNNQYYYITCRCPGSVNHSAPSLRIWALSSSKMGMVCQNNRTASLKDRLVPNSKEICLESSARFVILQHTCCCARNYSCNFDHAPEKAQSCTVEVHFISTALASGTTSRAGRAESRTNKGPGRAYIPEGCS